MREWLDVLQRMETCLLENMAPSGELVFQYHNVVGEMCDQQRWYQWEANGKPIMCIDFDGVISQYKRGWEGPEVSINENPIPGAINFIENSIDNFSVLIFSSRCNYKSGISSMKKWLLQYGLSEETLSRLVFQPGKPSFAVMIDDRAIHFHGVHSNPDEIFESFKPWYYEKEGWRDH